MGKYTDRFNQALTATIPGYVKEEYQTHATAIEWADVERSERVAKHLAEGNSWFTFPYFREFYSAWRIAYLSLKESKRRHASSTGSKKDYTLFELAYNDYSVMIAFISFVAAMECIGKGLASMPFWLFPKHNDTALQHKVAEVFSEYGQFLHKTPFYHFPFRRQIKPIYEVFSKSSSKSFVDCITLVSVTSELMLRQLFSAPAAAVVGAFSYIPETTDIIAKYAVDSLDIDEETLRADFHTKITQVQEQLRRELNDPTITVTIADHHGKEQLHYRTSATSKDREKHRSYLYAHLKIPRYEQFYPAVQALNAQNIKTKYIAGNSIVQVRVVVTADNQVQLAARINSLRELGINNKVTYSYDNSIDPNSKTVFIDMNTNTLNESLSEIERRPGMRIRMIHDF